jgi:hypothetical protein
MRAHNGVLIAFSLFEQAVYTSRWCKDSTPR